VQISSDLPETGIKLLVEKESIEYTLPRDDASRSGYIKILLPMKGRAKDEERRSILPSPPEISQARISTFVHLCASRRPQSTCYIPPSMGEKRRKQLSLKKFLTTTALSTLTHCCTRHKLFFSLSLPSSLFPFLSRLFYFNNKYTSIQLFS